jgi:FkbM family methyltransferase
MSELVYDIGMHNGDDSAFYLAKGFRVVAVEADPELCKTAEDRFGPFIDSGELTIVNRAIAENTGPVTLYRSTVSGWATVVEALNRDNLARGVAADSLVVDGMTLADLVEAYGNAFYLKVDIEGMDHAALRSLSASAVRPKYLSMETSFARWPKLASVSRDLELLTSLGYDRFKVVDQALVSEQVPPNPARAGRYVAHNFSDNASGLFGEEAPGAWLDAAAALEVFRGHCRHNRLPLLLYRNIRIYRYYVRIMRRLTGKSLNLDWYDIHAKHSSVG